MLLVRLDLKTGEALVKQAVSPQTRVASFPAPHQRSLGHTGGSAPLESTIPKAQRLSYILVGCE